MNFHLTGRMTASLNNVSVRWHYDTARGWPTSLLAALDLQELLVKWPQVRLRGGMEGGGRMQHSTPPPPPVPTRWGQANFLRQQRSLHYRCRLGSKGRHCE